MLERTLFNAGEDPTISRPRGVVYLSTIGAQTTHLNLLSQHTIIEQALRKVSVPITFLRPAWFMENSNWDVASAKNGLIQSFLQPLDKPVPMVATADIGCLAAELLQEKWKGHRVVELEGLSPVTPKEIAATFARLLGRPVRVEAVPRETWGPLFKSQGMKNPSRVFKCSMASMKDGSSLRVKTVAFEREGWSWKPCCGRSSRLTVGRRRAPQQRSVSKP